MLERADAPTVFNAALKQPVKPSLLKCPIFCRQLDRMTRLMLPRHPRERHVYVGPSEGPLGTTDATERTVERHPIEVRHFLCFPQQSGNMSKLLAFG